jgi:hypothetical protein
VVTELHENINTFMQMCRKTPPKPTGIKYVYAPMPEPKHVLQLDVYENRRYVLDIGAVQQVTVTHPRYDDNEHYPGGHITYWTLKAHDENEPDEVLDLFLCPAHGVQPILEETGKGKQRRVVYGEFPTPPVGAITTVICSSRDDAIALGNIACEVLNRLPTDIDWEYSRTNTTSPQFPPMRKFVERTALASWRPMFDFRQIPQIFINSRANYFTNIGIATDAEGVMQENKGFDIRFQCTGYAWSPDGAAKISLICSDSDLTDADEVEACPEGIYLSSGYDDTVFGADEEERNSPKGIARKAQVTSARRILDRVFYEMCGFVGSNASLRDMVRERTKFGAKALGATGGTSSHLVRDGLLDARNIIGFRVGTTLGTGKSTRMKVTFSTKLRELYTGGNFSTMPIWLCSFNRLDVVYVKERFLQALREEKTAVQAIFAAIVAVDQINLRIVSHESIRLETSMYAREADRSTTQHVCFGCNEIKLSREMIFTEDGGIYDQRCFKKIDSIPAVKLTIATCFLKRREILGDPSADVKAIMDRVVHDFVLDNGISYRCAYDSVVDNGFGPIEGYRPSIYLDRPSIEKPLQVTHDRGKTVLHSPNNAVVCRSIYNRLKGSSIVAVMAWLAELLRLRASIKDRPVQVGYNEEVKEEMEAFDAFTDNAYLIAKKIPFLNATRIALQLEVSEWDTLEQESRSGLWDGNLTVRSSRLWSKPSGMDPVGGGEGPDWNEDEIEILKKDLRDMQNSSAFNPHGLVLPTNADGSPCLWRSEVMPPDVDFRWLNRYMRARLLVWRTSCNKGRPTKESAATILLLWVLWWLRTGGKCHIFGFHMTPWARYDSVSSVGRGVYLFDEHGQETDVAIVAGAPLASGFTFLLPNNVNDPQQFDWTKMTAMVESWKANNVRWDHPVTIYPHLWDRLRLIAPSKPGLYEARKTLAEYTTHDFPRPPPYATIFKDGDEVDDADEDDEEVQALDEDIASREAPPVTERVEVGEEDDDDDGRDEAGGDGTGDGVGGKGAHGEQVQMEDDVRSEEQTEYAHDRATVEPYLQDCVKRLTSQHVDQFRSSFNFPIQLGETLKLFEEGRYKEAKEAADFLMEQVV